MPIQLILPDSSDLILGAPKERRRFLDWGTFHVEPPYLERSGITSGCFTSATRFFEVATGRAVRTSSRQLQSWTDAADRRSAEQVDASRRGYLERLAPVILSKLASLHRALRWRSSYRPGWREGETLEDCLREGEARDVKFGLTHYGPHRADLRVMIGDGAGGEQRCREVRRRSSRVRFDWRRLR